MTATKLKLSEEKNKLNPRDQIFEALKMDEHIQTAFTEFFSNNGIDCLYHALDEKMKAVAERAPELLVTLNELKNQTVKVMSHLYNFQLSNHSSSLEYAISSMINFQSKPIECLAFLDNLLEFKENSLATHYTAFFQYREAYFRYVAMKRGWDIEGYF
ncbi:MAG: hypothetical protein AAFO82_01700 [Bacteroidota bacterium]